MEYYVVGLCCPCPHISLHAIVHLLQVLLYLFQMLCYRHAVKQIVIHIKEHLFFNSLPIKFESKMKTDTVLDLEEECDAIQVNTKFSF